MEPIPLLSSFYFGSVEHYRLLAQHHRVVIDVGEHYERQSYRTRGITNDLPAARAARAAGIPFADYRFRVYDRAGLPCRTCGAQVVRHEAAGRGLFACPACQGGWLRGL